MMLEVSGLLILYRIFLTFSEKSLHQYFSESSYAFYTLAHFNPIWTEKNYSNPDPFLFAEHLMHNPSDCLSTTVYPNSIRPVT